MVGGGASRYTPDDVLHRRRLDNTRQHKAEGRQRLLHVAAAHRTCWRHLLHVGVLVSVYFVVTWIIYIYNLIYSIYIL